MKVTSTNNYYKISEINYVKHYFLSNLRVLCVVANVNLFCQSPSCLPVPPWWHTYS